MWNAHRVPPGFESKGLVQAQFTPSMQGYTKEREESFARELKQRVAALPGVESVAYASHLPLAFSIRLTSVAAEGRDTAEVKDWPQIDNANVGPGYFETMRIPVVKGRTFRDTDTKESPTVAIVNETMARQFWPGEDPLGRRLRIGGKSGYSEVIGVVKDGKYRTLGEANRPYVYQSLSQKFESDATLLARVHGDPGAALAAIRQLARQMDEKVPDIGLTTVEEAIGVSLIFPRAGAALFGLFGLLGLVLASIGLYGVIAYVVSQRTHEIGVRMALGAGRAHIFRMILGQGLKLTAIGVALGLLGALLMTRMISVLLYGISPTDALTFTLVPLALVLVAGLACFIPARRAAAVHPMVALRYE
jgi:predicted permease